jgi:2-hydroxy-3-keto-5-methylthiopentenyl-1-phosphate phosphatase
MLEITKTEKHYLLASDFDHTLSFNDSGIMLSEMLGKSGFEEKVTGLARTHLVQQGGELTYLILHDPDFRSVRREHLIEVGKRIRLKQNIKLLIELLETGIEAHRFSFHVISAAPEEVIQSALEGIVPPERIFGARFQYDHGSGEVRSIERLPAGYGKVAVLDEWQSRLNVRPDRVVYVGDGSSDIHVMLHVNRREGFTIAVSENKYIAPIVKRSILSDDALCVLIPILEDVAGWRDSARIRAFFETHGLEIQEWDKVRTDHLTIRQGGPVRVANLAQEAARV